VVRASEDTLCYLIQGSLIPEAAEAGVAGYGGSLDVILDDAE